MPVQTSYPGVYIQEVPSGVNTITGVATSIAAFIGRTAKGPLDRAVRCLSYTDFQRNFGGAHPKSDLSASVKQFFDNGGTDCYVIRIAHNAAKATATLKNLANAKVLVATARDGGLWGNNVYLTVDYNTPTPDETFNLEVTYEEAGKVVASETHTNLSMNPNHVRYAPVFVSQSSTLITLAKDAALNLAGNIQTGYSEGRTVFDTSALPAFLAALNAMVHHADPVQRKSRFTLSVDGSPYYDIDLHLDPANIAGAALTNIADDIQTRINTQLNAVQAGLKIKASWEAVDTDRSVLRLTSDTADQVSVKVRRAQSGDFAGPMLLGIDQGGIEPTRYRNFRPVANAAFLSGDINVLAKQTQNAFTTVSVSGTSVNLVKNGSNIVQTSGATHPWYRDANGGTDGVREKLKILAKHINAQANLTARAEVWGYHLALIATSGTNNTAATFTSVAAVDALFTANTRRYALGTTSASSFLSDGANGRDDDGNPLAVADYLGSQADQTGIYALDAVDLFNLALIPGDRDITEGDYLTIATTFSGFCKKKRAFLILDAPDSWTVKNRPVADASDVNDLRAYVVTDHSAVYYPKIVYSDAGIKKTMGPSGMIAGLYARTDNDAGVWKAPAGVNATLLGAIDLELNLTDGENGVLNKLGVNCLRKFPSGNVSWGARTLAGSDDLGSEWKYVPIRRLALMIGESLYRGTKWAVFEPNDEPLWARIRLSVGTFMHNLFRQGAFQGSTPSVAYYVKCDKETTTQADRNLGMVNIQVGFAPLKPAEFIVIQIQQMAGEL